MPAINIEHTDDLSTILAALRYYQKHGQGDPANRSDDIHAIAENNGFAISLDADGIDRLCKHINCEPDPSPLTERERRLLAALCDNQEAWEGEEPSVIEEKTDLIASNAILIADTATPPALVDLNRVSAATIGEAMAAIEHRHEDIERGRADGDYSDEEAEAATDELDVAYAELLDAEQRHTPHTGPALWLAQFMDSDDGVEHSDWIESPEPCEQAEALATLRHYADCQHANFDRIKTVRVIGPVPAIWRTVAIGDVPVEED